MRFRFSSFYNTTDFTIQNYQVTDWQCMCVMCTNDETTNVIQHNAHIRRLQHWNICIGMSDWLMELKIECQYFARIKCLNRNWIKGSLEGGIVVQCHPGLLKLILGNVRKTNFKKMLLFMNVIDCTNAFILCVLITRYCTSVVFFIVRLWGISIR